MASRRILIIDDEADIRVIAKASLQITRNWEVIVAASGKEGITLAHAKQPDAILLDVMMLGMNGLDTLQALKANPETRSIAVILLTATVKVTTQQQYAQLGAKAVITKPFDPGLLADQIEIALEWKEAGLDRRV